MSHMCMIGPQRRYVGAILFAVGLLPFIGATMLFASGFVLPSAFRSVFGLFVPPGVDAPDNWAVAVTRMVWLFMVSGSAGLVLCALGVWLSRSAVRPPVAADGSGVAVFVN